MGLGIPILTESALLTQTELDLSIFNLSLFFIWYLTVEIFSLRWDKLWIISGRDSFFSRSKILSLLKISLSGNSHKFFQIPLVSFRLS